MVDLTHIDLATPKDQAYKLDHWARLFKATTWEELKMIAKNNTDLMEASETLYNLNGDYLVRKQCEARADYYRLHNSINQRMKELVSENKALNSENQHLNSENQHLNSENLSLKNENMEKDIQIAQLKAQLAQKHSL